MTNSSSWGYSDNNLGPKTWLQRYKVAKGNLQSPINIDTAQVVVGDNVGPIQFQYLDIQNSTITNDGRHLQVSVIKNASVVNGGPLSERYQLAVIRFHWGSNSDTGSEHAINGQKYPLEVQLIHWNKDLYKNIGEAMVGENGLCIIGLLYQISDEDDEGLKPIIELLSRDGNKGCFSLEVKSTIDPNELIRDMTSYWTYQGSLTTPPLTENVTWVISENVGSLSQKQMEAFRTIRNTSGVLMADQWRPLCPQNDRSVRLCTCVVKSPSTGSQRSIISNHNTEDVMYIKSNSVQHYNGWNEVTQDGPNVEDLPSQDEGFQKDEKYTDTGTDEDKAFQSQEANHDDKDNTCDNEEEDSKSQGTNMHDVEEELTNTGATLLVDGPLKRSNSEKCNDGVGDDLTCHENDKDVVETALPEEPSGWHDSEIECERVKVEENESFPPQDANGEEHLNIEATSVTCSEENESSDDAQVAMRLDDARVCVKSEECDDVEEVAHKNARGQENEQGCESSENILHKQEENCRPRDEERSDLQEYSCLKGSSKVEVSQLEKNSSHDNYEEYSCTEVCLESSDVASNALSMKCDELGKVLEYQDTTSTSNDEECHATKTTLPNEDTRSHDNRDESIDKVDGQHDENTSQEYNETVTGVQYENTGVHGNEQEGDTEGVEHKNENWRDRDDECENPEAILVDQSEYSHVSIDEYSIEENGLQQTTGDENENLHIDNTSSVQESSNLESKDREDI